MFLILGGNAFSFSPLRIMFAVGLSYMAFAIQATDKGLISKIYKQRAFPGGSDGKASSYNARDPGSISGSRRSSGEGNGNTLQYSCLENSMDGEVCWSTVHEVTKSRTRLNNFTSLHTTQYQKNKQPNQKVGKRPKLTFLQTYRWLTNT